MSPDPRTAFTGMNHHAQLKILVLKKVSSPIFSLMDHAFGVVSKKPMPTPDNLVFLP